MQTRMPVQISAGDGAEPLQAPQTNKQTRALQKFGAGNGDGEGKNKSA
jgi:hypothetical protein